MEKLEGRLGSGGASGVESVVGVGAGEEKLSKQ